jgi:hypothetical protein
VVAAVVVAAAEIFSRPDYSIMIIIKTSTISGCGR